MNVFRYYVEIIDGGVPSFVVWPIFDPPLDQVAPITMNQAEFEDTMREGTVMIPAPTYIAIMIRDQGDDQSS